MLPRDVKFLLRTFGQQEGGDEWEALLALSRESRQKGWWHAHGDAISESFKTYVGLEAEANALRTYESEFVPGLLQTEDYAVMRVQLGRLVEASKQPGITLQVLPVRVGAHAGMDGAFMILDFPAPTDPEVAYVPLLRGDGVPGETAGVSALHGHVRALASRCTAGWPVTRPHRSRS